MSITEAEALTRLRDEGLDFFTREDWGSRRLSLYHERLTTRRIELPVDLGFVHISVTTDAIPEIPAAEFESMRAIEEIGWQRFGTGMSYNAAAHDTGRLMMGHPLTASGAHTLDDFGTFGPKGASLNGRAFACVLPQNVADKVTDLQVDAIARFFAAAKRAGLLRLTTGRLHGHREVSAKSCPGDLAWARMGDINDLTSDYIRRGLRAAPDKEDDDMALNDQVNTEHTAKQILNRMDRFIANSAARDKAAKERDEALLAAIREISAP